MKNIITLLLLAFSINLMAQSPWVKQKKESYLQLSYTFRPAYNEISGDTYYDTEREIVDNTLQLYGEYGLTDKTTLLINVPLKMSNSGALVNSSLPFTTTEESITALGNVNMGVKYNFINKKWLFSGQLNVEANTSIFDEDSGLRTGLDTWTITPLFVTGTSFNKIYLQGFTGFDIRTNNYSSSYKIGGEIGYKALKKMWLTVFFDGVFSFENGDVSLPKSNTLTGLYLNNQDYTSIGLKLIYEVNDNLGMSFGSGGAITAENIGMGPALTFGLYYKN